MTTIKWLAWVLCLSVAIAMAILGLEQNFRYGAWLDEGDASRPHFAVFGLSFTFGQGLLYGVINAFKIISPIMAMEVQSRLLRAGALSLFVLLSLFSAWNGFAVSTLTRADRASDENRKAQKVSDLRSEHAALLARIVVVGETRPVAQIEAGLAAEMHSRSWSNSKGCTDATSGDSRLFCTTFNRIRGELAAAKEAVSLHASAEALRIEIGAASPVGSINTELLMIQRLTGLDGDTVGTGRALLFAIVFELAEAFSLVLTWGCRTHLIGAVKPAVMVLSSGVSNHMAKGELTPKNETAPKVIEETAPSAAMSTQKCSMRPAFRNKVETAPKTVCIGSGRSRGSAPAFVAGSSLATANGIAPSTASIGVHGTSPSIAGKSALEFAKGRSLALTGASILPLSAASTERAATRNSEAAAAAVHAFVSGLPLAGGGRVTGGDLLAAYDIQRASYGWPKLPHNIFGAHLRVAVEKRGGRKIKTGGKQVYVGVQLRVS